MQAQQQQQQPIQGDNTGLEVVILFIAIIQAVYGILFIVFREDGLYIRDKSYLIGLLMGLGFIINGLFTGAWVAQDRSVFLCHMLCFFRIGLGVGTTIVAISYIQDKYEEATRSLVLYSIVAFMTILEVSMMLWYLGLLKALRNVVPPQQLPPGDNFGIRVRSWFITPVIIEQPRTVMVQTQMVAAPVMFTQQCQAPMLQPQTALNYQAPTPPAQF